MTKHSTMNINQKQEFRYQYAGMALQAIITNSDLWIALNAFLTKCKWISKRLRLLSP